jgi:hypothetical protein
LLKKEQFFHETAAKVHRLIAAIFFAAAFKITAAQAL